MIIKRLSDELLVELKQAETIRIASGMVTKTGVEFVTNEIKKQSDSRIRFLVGIDMPTPPDALQKLYDLSLVENLEVRLATNSNYFHPKVYIFENKHKTVTIIGSANCTSPGLETNTEMSYKVTDIEDNKQLIKWFDDLFLESTQISIDWLEGYKEAFEKRKKNEKEESKLAKKQKQKAAQAELIILEEQKELIATLKKHKKSKEYNKIVEQRADAVENLRSSLDYPNFVKIDIDAFFGIWDLGHIIPLPKPTIKKEINKFKQMLRILSDENIDVAERIDNCLDGEIAINGVNIGLISKLLTIHNPDKYFVRNGQINKVIKKFNIKTPRGLTEGQKYKIINKVLWDINSEVKMENFAVLDNFLYWEGEKI